MTSHSPQSPDNAGFDLDRARVCAIVNMGSGRKGGDEIAARLQQALQARCAALDVRRIQKGADLTQMARQAVAEGFDVVAAVGGDGTQAAVASALVGTGAAMVVIPGGTFNYFARNLGSGETVDEALRVFQHPTLRHVHVGDVNGMIFLNNISFGAYPEILRRRESIYRRWGRSRIAAYWSALIAVWNLRHPLHLSVRAQGREQRFTTALAFVARNAYQLETFGLEGADPVREGHLALLVARARKPWPLVRSALRLAFGKSARYADFDLICADEMQIRATPAHEYIAHDGEKTWMDSPFHVRVRHHALKVLVPGKPTGQDRA